MESVPESLLDVSGTGLTKKSYNGFEALQFSQNQGDRVVVILDDEYRVLPAVLKGLTAPTLSHSHFGFLHRQLAASESIASVTWFELPIIAEISKLVDAL